MRSLSRVKMQIKHVKINCKRYVIRNYGDGWDVHYVGGSEGIELLEEGCSRYEEAYKIAEEHSRKEV